MQTVLRDPHWRALEGAWRALDQFVRTVEMDGQVLLEAGRCQCRRLLGEPGGSRRGCRPHAAGQQACRPPLARGRRRRLCACWSRCTSSVPSAAELALLAGLGALAASEGAVLLGSAAAPLALIDAPGRLGGRRSRCRPMHRRKSAGRRCRSSWVAPHVGLVWPGVLARLPYGAKTQPVSGLCVRGAWPAAASDGELPWRSAALDLAALLARAFTDAGWDMQAESAVELEDLPAFIDRSGDEPALQAVAELYMSERQAQAVAQSGIMPLDQPSQPAARQARQPGAASRRRVRS